MNKQELKEKYGKEQVYVVESTIIKKVNLLFGRIKNKKIYHSFLNEIGIFKHRYDAEINANFRQIIPYCLVKFEDKYFMTIRKQGDERLIGKASLGIGGHINKEDSLKSKDILLNGLCRELSEELVFDEDGIDIKKAKIVGTILSSKTSVNRVHYGLVYLIEVSNDSIQVKETDVLEGKWLTKDEIKDYYDKLETWSQLVFDKYIG